MNQPQPSPRYATLQKSEPIIRLSIWIAIFLLTTALFFISIPIRLEFLSNTVDLRPLMQLRISATSYATYLVVLDVIVASAHALVAAILFLRKPNDWMAFFVSATLVVNGSILSLSQVASIKEAGASFITGNQIILYLGLVTSIVVLYIFPDGRFVPRPTILLTAIWVVLMAFAVARIGPGKTPTGWVNSLEILAAILFAGSGLVSQLYRYRKVSRPIERQQTKWALLGLAAACLGPILVLANMLPGNPSPEVPNIMYQRVGGDFFTTSFIIRLAAVTIFKLMSLLLPVSFAIAILKYRLWDIDIIIRKTLVYGALSGVLLAIYLGGILVLQGILGFFTKSSNLALILSTLSAFALFSPLRTRIQSSIDRRFYRSRYNAEQIFEAFTHSLRDKVDPNQISEELLGLLDKTLQPDHASLWLKPIGDPWQKFEKNH